MRASGSTRPVSGSRPMIELRAFLQEREDALDMIIKLTDLAPQRTTAESAT